jgi:hypothetical protein
MSARLLGLAVICLLASPAWSQDVLVTGAPASPAFLRQVLESRGWTEFPIAPLGPGQSWTSKGRRVTNLDWTPPAVSVAALSDHPEDVDRRGLLFSGGLTAQRPVRLQYYHLGSLAGAAPQVALLVSNPGGETARFHLVQAAGPPSLDYFSTGHDNNVEWFGRQQSGEGEFLDIEPGENRIVFRQWMPLDKVVSGTLGLTQVQGPPLQFGLLALPDSEEAHSMNNLLKESDVHSRGFYPVAIQRLRRRHDAGLGQETRMAVGALRQETFSGVRELRGDYGVLYDMEILLHNPLDRPSTFSILFNPRGGAATATFLWDGKVVEVPRTEAFAEKAIGTVTLPPRSQQTLRLQTIPEGASSYPIRIVIRD